MAGFDLPTYRKGLAPDLPDSFFTIIVCTVDRARERDHKLANPTVTLDITVR